MHTIRREIAHYSWTKIVFPGSLVTLHYTCNHPYIYVTKSKGMYITFNGTFHSLSLQANKTCTLWWWLIIYDKCNLQRLGSNVHLLMCHTINTLVKSNSVGTLKPTWAHFVMVSQKVITYCCKNIHPEWHVVIQYTHHMLIVQLPWFIQ
jgi:hypothetical protein